MDLEEAFEEQSGKAIKRDKGIRSWIKVTWIYFMIFTMLFMISILFLSNAVGRRSPALAYLKCHDSYSDLVENKARAYTYILVETKLNTDPSRTEEVAKLEKEYLKAEENLAAINTGKQRNSPCPIMPN